jgi:tetratricopeptide (TPR) repeat protein
MQILLDSKARKFGFLGTLILFAAVYLAAAGRIFLASHLANSLTLKRLQAAVWLDPSNAAYHEMVGRYLFQVAHDPEGARARYRAATWLNPHDAGYWLELASAEQVLDNVSGQRYALERAIQADPTTPEVAWDAANFFLVQGEIAPALREFKVVVENDRANAYAALQLSLHAADVDTIIRDVLPPNPEAHLLFLSLLTSRQDSIGAAKVWDHLATLGKPFESHPALDYVNYLILQRDVDRAHRVWLQTARLCGLSAYLTSRDNLIVNANLDSEILNNGFDWRYHKRSAVDLALDPTEPHNGHRSLAVEFTGPGVQDAGVFQFIPVEPEAEYEFSGYYKSDNIDGAGGPRFSIADAYTGVAYFQSDDLKDAEVWRSAGGQFKTGPETQLVVLRLARVPAGSPIRGKLWVADFRLTEKKP